ncbi:PEP-CTERM sorting domain-containing protein [Thermodesulfatator atlanticus]|uniref:PEP-CTERM sorting domain-containing protein n=1 Tax=Thermodesulfatator atlanticus TaxID=501497 RepID=UPI0003B45AAB|nr:PEP-CTERM sorting domain-containing protein [Thermodesulfatator atlanticus]
MKKLFLTLTLAIFFWAAKGQALTINVDGNLADWGLNTTNFAENGNNWDPGIPEVFVWQEDEVGANGYVGPGYGGQDYDVEAMLATISNGYLYLAISTGFPQSGTSSYDAGDISLDLGNDGTWDYAFIISNYVGGQENRGLTLGGLYKVTSWQDVAYTAHAVSNPFRMENGTYLGAGELAYEDDPEHSFSRYFIEAAIPLSLLNLSNYHQIKIHWTMECGNDYGEVMAHTPESASYMLLGAGLFAAGMLIRRKRTD